MENLFCRVILILLFYSEHSKSEFLQSCPSQCKCSWSAGKNSADCSYRSLQQIPDNFRTDLQVLIMDGNNLRILTKETFKTSKVRSLTDLSMTNCRLHLVSDHALLALTRLRTINLSNNNLTSLPTQLFQATDKLEEIILSGNQLTGLSPYQFPPLTVLRKLDLSHNIISSINNKAFLNLGHTVNTLDLRGNLLTTLHGQLLLPLYKVQHVFLMDNPWNCDCHLKTFRDFIIKRKLSPAQVSCYEPERLADKSWAEIESEDFACKPLARMSHDQMRASPAVNMSLECQVQGSPSPAVRWVRGGRILANMSSSPVANVANMKYIIREQTSVIGDSVTVNSSLIIQNVSVRDFGNYSCVAINRGGMAESRTELVLHQPGLWADILQELIIVIAVLGAAVACLFSLIVVKILANRKQSPVPGSGGMSLCSRSGSGYDDMSQQSLLHHSSSITRSLVDNTDRKPANTPVGSCEVPGLEQYYSPHPDQYPDLINIQYHHGHGHQEDMSPPPPPPDWQTNHPQHHHQDPYSGGANEIILMPPSPFSPTYNMKEVAEQEIDLQTTLQRRKLANMSRQSGGGGPRTLPKPIIKNCSNVTTENSVHFNTVSF